MATVKRTCAVDGCDRGLEGFGYCKRHYRHFKATGNPIPKSEWSLEQRLFHIGWDETPVGCWEWRGSRHTFGYGFFTSSAHGYDHALVHRLMYEVHMGGLTAESVVRHKCDNPPCVNPSHLEVGTQVDNINDMVSRGRHWAHGREACRNGHDITSPDSIYVDPSSGSKTCRECKRKSTRAHKVRKRLENADKR